MSDSYTEVTRSSFGQNLGGSIFGALLGVVLFIVSFPVLWWNQGRPNPGKIAERESVAITAPGGGQDGKFVSVSGTLAATEKLGDEYLKPGQYVSLARQVEMYAWIEKSESETRQKVGGGSETTTKYTYEKGWTSSPEDSSGFRHPEGHRNPEQAIKGDTKTVSTAKVGALSFAPGSCRLPGGDAVALTEENVILPKLERRSRLLDGVIYVGYGRPESPQVGDLKITYTALKPGAATTLFGQLSGDTVKPYLHKGKTEFFRLFASGREEAIATMKMEHKVTGYLIGLVGFLMMWFGMTMVFGPFQAVANIIPFIGNLSGKLIGCATFPIALVLTFITVMVSKLLHSPILMLGFGLAVAIGLGVIIKLRLAKSQAGPADAA